VPSSTYEVDWPLALVAIPVSPVCFIGGCLIEFFDPILSLCSLLVRLRKNSFSEASRY
jgi:hypothetical protein